MFCWWDGDFNRTSVKAPVALLVCEFLFFMSKVQAPLNILSVKSLCKQSVGCIIIYVILFGRKVQWVILNFVKKKPTANRDHFIDLLYATSSKCITQALRKLSKSNIFSARIHSVYCCLFLKHERSGDCRDNSLDLIKSLGSV